MKKVIIKISIFLFLIALLSFQEAKAIRIGLNEGVTKTYVGSSQNADFRDANTGKLLFISRSFFPYSIKAYGNSIAIKVKGRYYDCATNFYNYNGSIFLQSFKRKK